MCGLLRLIEIIPRFSLPNREYLETGDLQARILALFQSHPELPTKEIIASLGVPRTTLHRALTTLIETGVLERVGYTQATRYRLTTKL